MYKKEDIKIAIAVVVFIIIQVFIYLIIKEGRNNKNVICLEKCGNCDYCNSVEYNNNLDT